MSIFRDLFGPGTWGTGGNVVAAALLAIPGVVAAWFGRHKIGRGLASWWAKHHGPHAIAQHKQALREHEAEKRGEG